MAKKKPEADPEFWKPAELAKKLRVDQRVIYGMIDRGELRSLKVGRVIRIPADVVNEMVGRPVVKQKPKAGE